MDEDSYQLSRCRRCRQNLPTVTHFRTTNKGKVLINCISCNNIRKIRNRLYLGRPTVPQSEETLQTRLPPVAPPNPTITLPVLQSRELFVPSIAILSAPPPIVPQVAPLPTVLRDVTTRPPPRSILDADHSIPIAFFISFDTAIEGCMHTCGHFNIKCPSCAALHWAEENIGTVTTPAFSLCCKRGGYRNVNRFASPGPLISSLLTPGAHPNHAVFKSHIRLLNGKFAFVSISATERDMTTQLQGAVARSGGITSYTIQGELHHTHRPLTLQTGDTPALAQLYFFDPEFAAAERARLDVRSRVSETVYLQLSQELHRISPYIHMYKTAKELMDDWNANGVEGSVKVTVSMELLIREGADERRENLPTTSEVAALVDTRNLSSRNFILAQRNPVTGEDRYTRRIPVEHPLYHALAYPLMFPTGITNGYYSFQQLSLVHGRQVLPHRSWFELQSYQRYHLFPRAINDLVPFAYGRLFQQYLVDTWASLEQNKLEYLAKNQEALRSGQYADVANQLAVNAIPSNIGRRTVLPATHVGSPRFIKARYLDAHVLYRVFGSPTLFITMTANPAWPEIIEALGPGQSANDRPDIVARVFQLKLKGLQNDLFKQHCFGKAVARVWTIEYQKRGLPHAHVLLFLSPSARARYSNVEYIDRVISAEIPDPDINPVLHDLVVKNMIHGPCCADNPTAPCTQQTPSGSFTCKKKFPKTFRQETCVDGDGYPEYRRRSTGPTITKRANGRNVTLDNRNVVPYSPYLTLKYRCHINIEVVSSVSAIKYIFKYVYKGTDLTTVQITAALTTDELPVAEHTDEIRDYVTARYISPAEACWRLFEFHTHEEWPPVKSLTIHLENDQQVYFGDNTTRVDLQQRLQQQKPTHLMAFFQLNARNKTHLTDTPDILYQDLPTYYTWDQNEHCWNIRKKSMAAYGRIHPVPAHLGEIYYLRLLLLAVPSPTSFLNLRTINDLPYRSNKEACVALGLLEDDRAWIAAMHEGKQWAPGYAFRSLFAQLLIWCDLTSPLQIWEQFRIDLSEDLLRAINRKAYRCADPPPELPLPEQDWALADVESKLLPHGKTLLDYGLPVPQHPWLLSNPDNWSASELEYDIVEEQVSFSKKYALLTTEQRLHFDEITSAVEAPLTPYRLDASGKIMESDTPVFFLHGPGGTGKTFLYSTLNHYFRSQQKIAINVASSGIAALLLDGGTTAHSRFRIPIPSDQDSICPIEHGSPRAKLFQAATVIIWDEVPMQNRYDFVAVDRMLRDLRDQNRPFGGLPVIFGGDFGQILPVVPRGSSATIINACIQREPTIWPRLNVLKLTKNMRVLNNSDNVAYAQWLRRLVDEPSFHPQASLPSTVRVVNDEHALFNAIYPEEILQQPLRRWQQFSDRSILATRNITVNALNDKINRLLTGTAKTYRSANTATVLPDSYYHDASHVPQETLDKLDFPSIPPSQLHLKIGTPVMMMRNLSPELGLVNGTRLQVVRLLHNLIITRILTGKFRGQERIIFRIKLMTSREELPFCLQRTQFPLRLCFAMTINKSQGQSFQQVGIDFTVPPFSHGQTYVAFSRAVDVAKVVVLPTSTKGRPVLPDTTHEAGTLLPTKVANVVWPEVLI